MTLNIRPVAFAPYGSSGRLNQFDAPKHRRRDISGLLRQVNRPSEQRDALRRNTDRLRKSGTGNHLFNFAFSVQIVIIKRFGAHFAGGSIGDSLNCISFSCPSYTFGVLVVTTVSESSIFSVFISSIASTLLAFSDSFTFFFICTVRIFRLTPHECTVCYKQSRRAEDFKKHMLTHSEGRPFGCDICGKKIHTKSYVRRHSENRPFVGCDAVCETPVKLLSL